MQRDLGLIGSNNQLFHFLIFVFEAYQQLHGCSLRRAFQIILGYSQSAVLLNIRAITFTHILTPMFQSLVFSSFLSCLLMITNFIWISFSLSFSLSLSVTYAHKYISICIFFNFHIFGYLSLQQPTSIYWP